MYLNPTPYLHLLPSLRFHLNTSLGKLVQCDNHTHCTAVPQLPQRTLTTRL